MLYTLPRVFDFQGWTTKAYTFTFPVAYLTGNLRVYFAYVKWKSWQILMYKAAIIISGLLNFYIGFKYLNGAYKITRGIKPEV